MFYGQTIPRAIPQVHRGQYRDIDKGLVGHWTFDTDANDVSGNSNNGTVYGGAVRTRGIIRGAYKFDGVDDYINCGSDSSLTDLALNAITISAWIKPNSTGENGTGRIACKRLPSTGWGGWLFFTDNVSSLGAQIVGDSGTVIAQSRGSDNAIVLNKWTHVVMVYDNNGDKVIKIYANGKEIRYDVKTTATASPTSDNGGDLFIANTVTDNRHFDGIIADMRIYNRVLAENEIRQLYQLGVNKVGITYGSILKTSWVYSRTLSVTGTSSASLSRGFYKTLPVTEATTTSISRIVKHLRTLFIQEASGVALSLQRIFQRTLSVATITTASLIRKFWKTLSTTEVSVPTLSFSRFFEKLLSAVATTTATLSIQKLFKRTLSAIESSVATLSFGRFFQKTLSVIETTTASLSISRVFNKILSATATTIATLTRGRFFERVLSATSSITASLSLRKKFLRTLKAVATTIATITHPSSWGFLTKKSTTWTKPSKPSTSWTDSSKPSTNWNFIDKND